VGLKGLKKHMVLVKEVRCTKEITSEFEEVRCTKEITSEFEEL
jgi:hypothetical protein